MNRKELNTNRQRRAKRARAKIGKGVETKPRLSVFRSNQHIYAQIIDDAKGKTIASASSHEIKKVKNKTNSAKEVGELIAKKASEAGIKSVVFDKGRYTYHGRVKTLADAAREKGLKI